VKILELGKFYPPERGGIETLLQTCSEGFVQAGHEVDCVVAHRRLRSVTQVTNGVRVHRLGSFGSALSTSLSPRYLRATHRHPADIWHAHFPNPLADLACITGPKRVPLVLHWHSDVVRQSAVMRIYAPLLQSRLLARADLIIVATPLHLEHSRWLPPHRDKVRVVPYGLDLRRFQASPELLAQAAQLRATVRVPGRPILLNIGRMVGYKGQKFLIEAMREIDAELWLAGEGPLRSDLEELTKRIGVTDKVVFCGNVSDEKLPALLQACDVFVFPSITTNEAFGLAMVEAMACHKPIVACTLASGVSYVCSEGVNGLLCEPADSAGLARTVKTILNDKKLATRLGVAGHQRAHEEFSAPVMVERLLRHFSELLARKSHQ